MNTSKIVGTLLAGLCLGILAVGSANGGTAMETARTQPWEAQNVEAIKELFSDKSSVNLFIQEVYAERTSIVVEPILCEHEITDMKDDGRIELVATLSEGGRFCNTIYVVENVNGAFKTYKIYGDGSITDLKSRIIDLHRDGLKQVLVPRFLAPYDGANPIPIIDDIYEWRGGVGFRKANASFKEYYRSLLPRLQSELEDVRKGQKLDVPSHKALLEKKYEKEIEEVNKILNE
jgi:hypothetical protein